MAHRVGSSGSGWRHNHDTRPRRRGDRSRTMTEHTDQGAGRPRHEAGHAHAADQPFEYPLRREYVEPDWRRLPGFRDITKEQWESAQWQRAHTIKNLVELKRALGDLLTDDLYADIERDQLERATMSM